MKWKKWLWVLFVILLLYGGLIRIYGLGQKNLWIDESISAIASRNILNKGIPIFSSGKLYNRAYLFHYGMAGFLLFGQNEFNARMISVLFGLATCVLIFLFGKEFNKKTGWIGFVLSLFLDSNLLFLDRWQIFK
jgi:predicted membrane-bound mannosyltransferase